jgi:hypothetical protein
MCNSAKYLDGSKGRFVSPIVSRSFLLAGDGSQAVFCLAGIPEGAAQAVLFQQQLVPKYLIVAKAGLG